MAPGRRARTALSARPPDGRKSIRFATCTKSNGSGGHRRLSDVTLGIPTVRCVQLYIYKPKEAVTCKCNRAHIVAIALALPHMRVSPGPPTQRLRTSQSTQSTMLPPHADGRNPTDPDAGALPVPAPFRSDPTADRHHGNWHAAQRGDRLRPPSLRMHFSAAKPEFGIQMCDAEPGVSG